MPLGNDCSEEGRSRMIAELVNSGKSQEEAVAIVMEHCGMSRKIKSLLNTGGLIKAVAPLTFEGHLVRYGQEGDKDLDREWFSPKTYFMLEAGYPVKGAPTNYQHGMEDAFGNLPIGLFNFVDQDEIGLFVRAQLNTMEKYQAMLREIGRVKGIKMSDTQYAQKSEIAFKAVQELVSTVPLRQSMGADIATFRVNGTNGHIEQCGIVHGALTPTPSDNKNPLVRFKSALDYAYDLESTTFYSIPEAATNGGVTVNVYTSTAPQTTEAVTVTENLPDSVVIVHEDGGRLSDTQQSTKDKNPMKHRINWKALSPEQKQMFLDKVTAFLGDVIDQIDMEPGGGEMETMAAEMMDNLEEQTAPGGVVEEAATAVAADVADLPPDQPLTEETVQQIVTDNLEQILPEEVKRYMEKQAQTKAARKNAVKTALEGYMANAPTTSMKSQVGGLTGQQAPRITNMELMRYAHLTGHDMALGVKMMHAAFKRNGFSPRGLKLGDLVSEEYARVMAHKIMAETKDDAGFKALGRNDAMMNQDRLAFKAALPFKADELDATAITNQGAEWVFIDYDTRLWEYARHETLLFNKLVEKGMRTMDVSGKTMDVKLHTGSPTLYTASEGRNLDATGRPEVVVQTTPFTTSNVQVDIVKHMLATSFTGELDEDSIINIVQFVNEDAMMTVAEGIESAVINGDTTTTAGGNINTSGTPGTGLQKPAYLAWDGLRHHVLVDNTGQGNAKGAALEYVDYERTIKLFDSAIRNRKANMLFVVDSDTESHTRRLPEVLTDDVKKNGGTAFGGPLPAPFGVDLYMSGFLDLSLATGYIHATTGNVKGQILCVYAPYWQFGRKRDVEIEFERYAQSDATVVVVRVRHILVDRGDNAATMTFNLTVSS